MSTRAAGILAFLAVAVPSALLYSYRLDFAPPHIQIDEALISISAHSIASTGRDLRGELLPLYSQTAPTSWYQPLVIYLTASALTVLPLNEWSVRVPAVVMGLVSIGLMFLVAQGLFKSYPFATIAAAMLALSPGLFIHSRYAMDYHYPIPFILGWLLCLVRYTERRQPWLLVAGSGILGVGFYCYISSIVMMPLYFLFTLLLLYMQQAPRRAYGLAAAGFLPALLPFLVWIAGHPEAYSATIAKYGLYDSQLNAAQGLRSTFSFLSVAQRLSQYWNYFDPALLFFGSGIKVQFSTGLAGVFLLPVAVFLVAGVVQALKRRAEPLHLILLLGFVTAPLVASIPTEENAIFRALGLMPFGVLLAAVGVHHFWFTPIGKPLSRILEGVGLSAAVAGAAYAAWTLLTQARITASPVPLVVAGLGLFAVGRMPDRLLQLRLVTLFLLALMPLQFMSFWSDYFSSYRERVAFWLGGNIGGALEEVIGRTDAGGAPGVYFGQLKAAGGQLDWRNDYMGTYWKYYLIKHNRQDLADRSHPLDATAIDTIPERSLIVANLDDATTGALVKNGALRVVATIPELDHKPFFVVLQK